MHALCHELHGRYPSVVHRSNRAFAKADRGLLGAPVHHTLAMSHTTGKSVYTADEYGNVCCSSTEYFCLCNADCFVRYCVYFGHALFSLHFVADIPRDLFLPLLLDHLLPAERFAELTLQRRLRTHRQLHSWMHRMCPKEESMFSDSELRMRNRCVFAAARELFYKSMCACFCCQLVKNPGILYSRFCPPMKFLSSTNQLDY